jgi:glycerol uptake facilitator protein
MKSPFIAELIGTMLLIIFGDGVVANVLLNKSKGQNSGWIVIATGWAMAVAVGVYASWPISGAHINPAVTIGLAVIGKFPWAMVVPYIIAQMIGAFLGAVIVWLAYRKHLRSRVHHLPINPKLLSGNILLNTLLILNRVRLAAKL